MTLQLCTLLLDLSELNLVCHLLNLILLQLPSIAQYFYIEQIMCQPIKQPSISIPTSSNKNHANNLNSLHFNKHGVGDVLATNVVFATTKFLICHIIICNIIGMLFNYSDQLQFLLLSYLQLCFQLFIFLLQLNQPHKCH